MQTISQTPRPPRAAAVRASIIEPGHWIARMSLALVLAAVAGVAMAQTHVREVGAYVLRSSVVASTAIAGNTARAHGIEPGPGTAVLNVVVLKKDGQTNEPVAADVHAEVRNLLGASHSVALKEVRSNGRVSYISSFTHAPAEALNVRISATPSDGGPDLELEFQERIGATGGRS